MSFSRRITLALSFFALLAVVSIASLTSNAAHGDWTALVAFVPVLALLVYELQLIYRQRPLAHAADELRRLRLTIPAATQRLYLPAEGDVAVQCNPASGPWKSHQFTCLQLEDVADLDGAEANEVIYLGATTYKVSVGLPLIQRTIWAEGAVKRSKHGAFHGLPRQKQTLTGALRAMWLDHKAGVLTPTADELSEVVRIMRSARSTVDMPLETGR